MARARQARVFENAAVVWMRGLLAHEAEGSDVPLCAQRVGRTISTGARLVAQRARVDLLRGRAEAVVTRDDLERGERRPCFAR